MRRNMQMLIAAAIAVSLSIACVTTAKEDSRAEKGEASIAGTVKLLPPQLDRSAPLMQALKDRRSERSYSDRKLSRQQLANLLWAANGVNRDGGKRTSPSPHNVQGIDIYVVLEEGAYVYDTVKHVLVPVVSGDHRRATGKQEFVAGAPLNLAYVADTEVIRYDPGTVGIPVGCMVQNVYLYCASDGLGSVVRGSFDAGELAKALNLRTTQRIYITQTVGYPKEREK